MNRVKNFNLSLALFIAVFSIGGYSIATDVIWIHLNVRQTYNDVSGACSQTRPGGDLYFSAEVENGKVTKGNISNFPYIWAYKAIYKNVELSPSDVSKIELFRDQKGRYWLKKLPLSESVLRWALYYSIERSLFCHLPQLLSTVTPAPLVYEFETESILEGILVSYSQSVSYSGQRSDGQPYRTTMGLVQREFGQ